MQNIQSYLLGESLESLQEIVKQYNLPTFTAKQIAQWLYQKKVTSIEEMTNLSKIARIALGENFEVSPLKSPIIQTSADGTRKYLFPKTSGIEAVVIPDQDRSTLCISSQEGCAMGCKFCMTGRMGFLNQLSPGEIIGQFTGVEEADRLTNVVYMGMGEPFNNFEAVMDSIKILTSPWGMAWSPRRITVSTVGILPRIPDFMNLCQAHLAISVHNPISKERAQLMPVEDAYPLEKVMECLQQYDFHGQRRISFEYTLFDGWNDTPAHAKALVRLLRSGNGTLARDGRVNLIRFHAIPDSSLRPSSREKVLEFQSRLTAEGILAPLRASKGEDIMAACGLLSSKKE